MMCKTLCGRDTGPELMFCDECWQDWLGSKEAIRADLVAEQDNAVARIGVAQVDFCDRMRAERQSRRPA